MCPSMGNVSNFSCGAIPRLSRICRRTSNDVTLGNLDQAIAEQAQHHPDFALFEALPGAGAALAPRLLVAFGEQRERYGSAAEVQTYAGIAPVMERSGKRSWVPWRCQCPKFLRQTFVEWAAESMQFSFWARAY